MVRKPYFTRDIFSGNMQNILFLRYDFLIQLFLDVIMQPYGFLSAEDRPMCHDEAFDVYQFVGSSTVVCVEENGDFIGDPLQAQDLPDREITTYCKDLAD